MEEILCSVFFTAMIVLTIANVVSRYLFGITLNWAQEIAVESFVIVVFAGISVCYKKKAHIYIDIFISALPEKIQKVVLEVVNIFVLMVTVYLTYLALKLTINSAARTTRLLGIPYYFINFSAVIGFGMMSFWTVVDFVKNIRKRKEY